MLSGQRIRVRSLSLQCIAQQRDLVVIAMSQHVERPGSIDDDGRKSVIITAARNATPCGEMSRMERSHGSVARNTSKS